MASELWRKAFEKLKFPDNEHSPGTYENNIQTDFTSQKSEMLEYKTNDEAHEKFQVGKEKTCVSQKGKLSKKKSKLILPLAETKEAKEPEKNCEGTIADQKEMIDKKVSNEGNGKSKKASHFHKKEYWHSDNGAVEAVPQGFKEMDKNVSDKEGVKSKKVSYFSKKNLTTKEMHLLKIMKQSGEFRKVNEVKNNDFFRRNSGICRYEKPVLADHKSESNLSLNNVDSDDYVDNIPLTGLVSANRYTQADRMASHPIMLSEIWDDEVQW